MNKKVLVFLAIILGILFFLAAGFYFVEPAKSLPGFFPGYDPLLVRHHYTHGTGTLLLGVACFIFAWFNSKK